MMKKGGLVAIIFAAFLCCTVFIVGCSKSKDVKVNGISLTQNEMTLEVGESAQLFAIITPTNAAVKTVTWRSDNDNIATVDKTGLVTGISAGGVEIFVKSDDGDFTASCFVVVRAKEAVNVETITVPDISVVNGENATLTVNYSPSNATVKSVNFSIVSGGDFIDLASTGVVTAKRVGSAVVKASWTENSDIFGLCTVSVISAPAAVESVFFDDEDIRIFVGTQKTLGYSVNPLNAVNKAVRFEVTLGNEYVSIDGDGVVTGLGLGVATVKITSVANPDAFDTCGVIVETETLISDIEILTPGPIVFSLRGNANDEDTLPLDIGISPLNASNQDLHYASSSEAVATVDNLGLITARGGGVCEITVSTTDGSNISRKIAVQVELIKEVNSITVTPGDVILQIGGTALAPEKLTQRLELDILPITASNKAVEFTLRQSETVIEISTDGLITAKKAGTATVMVNALDGSGVQANCSVTVKEYVPVTGISVTPSETVNLKIGGVGAKTTQQLSYTVTPAAATVKGAVFTSSDPSVASVSENGLITALYHGSAVITVTALGADGGAVSASVTVGIARGVTGVRVNPATLTLEENGSPAKLYAMFNPQTATNKNVSWHSSDPSVVTVNADGTVVPKNTGIAFITVTTEDGAREAQSTITVVASGNIVRPTGISLPSAETLPLNGTKELFAAITPQNASGTVTWSSSDPSKVTVSGGLITGIAVTGEPVIITASISDGNMLFEATCAVTVSPVLVSVITVTPNPVTLTANGPGIKMSVQLTAVTNPAATNKALIYSVKSGGEFIEISASGLIMLKPNVTAAGEAVVTVASADGGYTVDIPVVIEAVTLVSGVEILDDGPIELEITGYDYGTKQLTVRVTPSDAFNAALRYRSSNVSVAYVDADGLITAVGNGTAVIIVTALDGSGAADTITVNVTEKFPVGSITINNGDFRMQLGGVNPTPPVTLSITILPASADDKTIEFEVDVVSGEGVVSVSPVGVVTALSPGVVTITAKALDGSGVVSSPITVTVEQINLVSSVAVEDSNGSSDTVELTINGANKITEQLRATVDAAATLKTVEWSSSDTSIVSVSVSGLITARKSGTAVITATALDGSAVSGSINVNVTVISTDIDIENGLTVNLIKFNPELDSVVITAVATAGALTPSNTGVMFSLVNPSDSQYVTLTGNTVTAVSNTPDGGIKIRVAALDGGASKEITVYVSTATDSIELSPNKTKVYTNDPSNDTAIISVIVNAGASTLVDWSFSGGEAGVNFSFNALTGEFKGLINGTYTVTATAKDNPSKTSSVTITVETKVTGVTVTGGEELSGTTLTLMEAKSAALTAVITPNTATNKIVSFETGNEAIATVDGKGVVKGVAIGSTTVTVYANKGLIDQAAVVITVNVTENTGPAFNNPWNATTGGQVKAWEDEDDIKGLKTALTYNLPIELVDDIDASATQSAPWVGSVYGYNKIFNGNGFKITNFTVDGATNYGNGNGMFQVLGGTNKNYENVAQFLDLTLENPVMTGGAGSQVGFFAGQMPGANHMAYFNNVHIVGASMLNGSGNYRGGFIGNTTNRAEIILDNSSFEGVVENNGGEYYGGVIGRMDSSTFLWSRNFVLDVTLNILGGSRRTGAFTGRSTGDRAQLTVENLTAAVVINGTAAGERNGGLFGEIEVPSSSSDANGAKQDTLTHFGRIYDANSRYIFGVNVDITVNNSGFAEHATCGGLIGWTASNLVGLFDVTGTVYGGNEAKKFAGNSYTDTNGAIDISDLAWVTTKP